MSIRDLQRQKHPAGGEMIRFLHHSEKVKPGTERPVSVYIPGAAVLPGEMAVHFSTDGTRDCEPYVTEKLIASGAMPPTVSIGVTAASYPATLPGGTARSVRSPEYDGLGPSFADYLIDDLLPEIRALLPEGLAISESPDLHAISGCSSGGICAWNACWERNDYFRRCTIYSPTFSSFRGGDSLTVLMRKYETKRIRCYMTVGNDDMRNSAGDWYFEAMSAREAMEYAGYEFGFELFQSGTHGVGSCDTPVMERAQRFIWKDWQTRKVGIRHFPPRVADIFTPDTAWEETGDPMPAAPECPYAFRGSSILLNGKPVAECPWPVSDMALSSDRWRLYVATPARRFVYAYAVLPDGSLADPYPHAHLHLKDDLTVPGASGICIDSGDRLYAATEPGIQTTSQQGENNTILPLPGNPAVVSVAFGGDGMLYARSEDGKIWRRPVLTKAPDGTVQPPDTPPF